jgi:hypothetical protein
MQSNREFLKNKAKKFAKQTWAGPGKFGVFIILCIIVVATFEGLGLSNREKNLEIRTVQNIVLQMNEEVENGHDLAENTIAKLDSSINQKLRLSTKKEFEQKKLERENILLFGAVDQYLFENSYQLPKGKSCNEEKLGFFLSMLLSSVRAEEIIEMHHKDEEILLLDI